MTKTFLILLISIPALILTTTDRGSGRKPITANSVKLPIISEKEGELVYAVITAYTVFETCPDRPCIMASGKVAYVGAVACPREIALGTKVRFISPNIFGDKIFTCEDRTHIKYNGRFDIFMEDYQQAKEWGKKKIFVKVYPLTNL